VILDDAFSNVAFVCAHVPCFWMRGIGMSESTAAACDGLGSSSTYQETIDASSSVSKRIITASGCPNHYSLCTGKSGTSGCGGVGEAGTATEATEQDYSLELPASPVFRDSWGVDVTASNVQCSTDAVAIALNGVTILTGAVGGDDCDSFLDVDDIDAEWNSFDCCSGHTRSFEGATYHYHFPPSCLLNQIGDLSDGHSPQIGWAFDGFPVYGPKGPGGIDMTYGGSYGSCTGDYCLDQCGGVQAELPEVDRHLYRYYVVGATSDLSTLPGNPKPSSSAAGAFSTGRKSFTLNCYRGYLYSELTGGSTGTSGVTSSYTATALSGVTTTYEPSGLCAGGGFTTIEEALNGFCSTHTSSSCNADFSGFAESDATTATTDSPTDSPTRSPTTTADSGSCRDCSGTKFVLSFVNILVCLKFL
jgi:hypothetical protein